MIIMVGAILLTCPAGAIDKTKKDTTIPKTKPPAVDTARKVDKAVGGQNGSEQKASRSKYDDFVDVNGNGIDDRAEKQSTAKPKREPAADSTAVKPPKK
jgi:hypothetical protein